jgi:steroid 5-alpha reductase family enzyme|tara:strand:+ start:470 stop:1396 length:927 start_codon:yes stop_codon:yes gene_type:complete
MKYFKSLLPFIAGWALLLVTDSFAVIGLYNGLLQLALFGVVVGIPIWMTGRMSYVDIGWPLGLIVIGGLTWVLSDGQSWRVALVSVAYIFAGSRMGFGALKLWSMGRLKQEFPRYEYQKQRWIAAGKTNVPLAMQVDALWQGLANASFLAMPAFIIASNSSEHIHILEVVGVLVWGSAFAMESIADFQKLAFLQTMKKAGERNRVCNVGLWKHTRHPNYFAEWMVWNGLIIAAVPSFLNLYGAESLITWLLLGIGLLFASWKMYSTLVFDTGAEPSEYYSVQKRPDYKTYQQTTNMFFPGPNKTLDKP